MYKFIYLCYNENIRNILRETLGNNDIAYLIIPTSTNDPVQAAIYENEITALKGRIDNQTEVITVVDQPTQITLESTISQLQAQLNELKDNISEGPATRRTILVTEDQGQYFTIGVEQTHGSTNINTTKLDTESDATDFITSEFAYQTALSKLQLSNTHVSSDDKNILLRACYPNTFTEETLSSLWMVRLQSAIEEGRLHEVKILFLANPFNDKLQTTNEEHVAVWALYSFSTNPAISVEILLFLIKNSSLDELGLVEKNNEQLFYGMTSFPILSAMFYDLAADRFAPILTAILDKVVATGHWNLLHQIGGFGWIEVIKAVKSNGIQGMELYRALLTPYLQNIYKVKSYDAALAECIEPVQWLSSNIAVQLLSVLKDIDRTLHKNIFLNALLGSSLSTDKIIACITSATAAELAYIHPQTGETAFLTALQHQPLSVIQALVATYARETGFNNKDFYLYKNGNAVVHAFAFAASNQNPDVFNWLVNLWDSNYAHAGYLDISFSPSHQILHWAATHNTNTRAFQIVVDYFLSHSGDPVVLWTQTNEEGLTPLQLAVIHDNDNALKYILSGIATMSTEDLLSCIFSSLKCGLQYDKKDAITLSFAKFIEIYPTITFNKKGAITRLLSLINDNVKSKALGVFLDECQSFSEDDADFKERFEKIVFDRLLPSLDATSTASLLKLIHGQIEVLQNCLENRSYVNESDLDTATEKLKLLLALCPDRILIQDDQGKNLLEYIVNGNYASDIIDIVLTANRDWFANQRAIQAILKSAYEADHNNSHISKKILLDSTNICSIFFIDWRRDD